MGWGAPHAIHMVGWEVGWEVGWRSLEVGWGRWAGAAQVGGEAPSPAHLPAHLRLWWLVSGLSRWVAGLIVTVVCA